MKTMITLKEAADRTGLSYKYLREGCLEGRLVHIRSGNKFFVNYEKLQEYLDRGDKPQDDANVNKGMN